MLMREDANAASGPNERHAALDVANWLEHAADQGVRADDRYAALAVANWLEHVGGNTQ